MGVVQIIKNRQQIKKETKDAVGTIANMNNAKYNLLNEYYSQVSNGQASPDTQLMLREVDGQWYYVGAVRDLPSDQAHTSKYEFVLAYQQPNGELTGSYYNLSSVGDFGKNDRGIGTITITYLSNVNGNDVPCTIQMPTSTQDLRNIQDLTEIAPRLVTPSISLYTPEQCIPDLNEFKTVLAEFCMRENIYNAQHIETTADFMPGGR